MNNTFELHKCCRACENRAIFDFYEENEKGS